ncbi:E3 ubiquitin-protein ligase [Aspergillus undulatus]|uniref:E3 ubiquitin-protein ligase n=1 Tax=Aspergillus undulatus TaxID=1810928 RepID=UPI003CCCDAC5
MPLSLSVPSFSRPSTSSPLHRSRTSSTSYSTTLSEALRNNPFSGSSQTRSRTPPPVDPALEERKREQEELNRALETLVQIFPDVKIEVFRELLVRFDGNSRLHVCVEQLLRHKEKWVAGRWNVPTGPAGSEDAAMAVVGSGPTVSALVPREEQFRAEEYKVALKGVLTREFSGLSRSAVDAVLAEVNFCYLRARPILQDLSRKTWRATINSILPSFRRKKDKDDVNPLVLWQRQSDGELLPRLKETGCEELDLELHESLLAPMLRERQEERERVDLQLAEELNEKEAEEASALYECECCFTDVTFEQISTCSDGMHFICFNCIRHTVHQALFGQGWSTSVDVERSTLKCLAPSTSEPCTGILSAQLVKRAILLDKAGLETYSKLESRLASDALLRSQFKLIRCPFCSYAEVDPVYHPPTNGVNWRFRREGLIPTFLMMIIFLDTIPFLLVGIAISYLFDPTAIPTILNSALLKLCLQLRMKKFTCANVNCRQASCITCQKPWRDPHVCHEPLLLDLRATVEAARTAAVKRTCPRCGLSFVKSSGCNKLTCTCGYSMCYLCRKALGPPLRGAPRNRRRPRRQENIDPGDAEHEPVAEDEYEEGNEGYRHFCEHFRVNPGARCTACNKCELYQDEDEEAVARRAGEKAEHEWRVRHQMAAGSGDGAGSGAGIPAVNVNHDLSVGTTRGATKYTSMFTRPRGKSFWYWVGEMWRTGQWKVEGQAAVDWVVERVIVIEEI